MNPFIVIAGLLVFSLASQADESIKESEILAKRGNGVVTQSEFTARANKIPADDRLAALRDANRLEDVITTLLLRAQLAADAREAGFDSKQLVKDRMQLASEAELAEAWMAHYVESQPDADYLQLAKEYYQLHQDEIVTSPKIDVSHILIAFKEHSEEEALELATSLSERLEENPDGFNALVLEYSDDPSAKSNKGIFKGVRQGQMVRAFEETAFALDEGEISPPVKTEYGYHIIRLDAHIPPEQIPFDDVKQRLVDSQKQLHEQRILNGYLSSLASLDMEMSEQALEVLVERLYGEEYIDPGVSSADQK